MLRARGNKGELAAIPLSKRLGHVKNVLVNNAPLEIEQTWTHGEEVILKFKGIDTISDAERLAGGEVCIPFDQRPQAPPGEYYQSDLVSCEVFDQTGRSLGTVRAWQDTGGVPLLEIETGDGKELLIPFAQSMLAGIDLERKRIDVSLPDGLIDLN